ncbi:ferredoxin [Natranaerofaba carboxydovora]|uniref:ferredoxin n=1 Tax=Natranaerofaba carboxydovora TaxID=2742683 RepID=UPI001F12FA59|nr:ferredoxin [Natranaerofaba carboxydovora]UMZ74509.1 Ferredoxin [Natranaerofaba carboxydovora]
MKVEVDQELCISCGLCVDEYPEVFEWNDEGIAQASTEEVPEGKEDDAKDAIEDCPTEAIKEV